MTMTQLLDNNVTNYVLDNCTQGESGRPTVYHKFTEVNKTKLNHKNKQIAACLFCFLFLF